MLEGRGLTKSFGGLVAVKGFDFTVGEKEIVGLIGPNGAGKTTIFNLVTGVYPVTSGTIRFCGKEITGLKTHQISRQGIARVFQLVRPFLSMTVLENVVIGILGRERSASVSEARDEAKQYLDFVGLLDKKDTVTRNLNVFGRKKTELARSLASTPKLLLLDEYASGLNPTEVLQANELVRTIRDNSGITVFWVEHVMKAVMETSERIMVIHHGEKIADATPKEVACDQRVVDAYLGERYA